MTAVADAPTLPGGTRPTAHIPVLLDEVLDWAVAGQARTFVDGTFGFGGHSRAILARHPHLHTLIGLDRDGQTLAACTDPDPRLRLVHAPASAMAQVLADAGLNHIDGVLLDLGVNSAQLDTATRGFSFSHDGPLDMRMDAAAAIPTAAELVNTWPEAELIRIFFEYGEERCSRRIARALVEARENSPFLRTRQLADAVRDAIPARLRPAHIHPATRVFMALRIAVNDELAELRRAVAAAIDALAPGGRLSIITFHSLEDRIVKQAFVGAARGCVCPPAFPVCTCGKEPVLQVLTRKPVVPGAHEIAQNPRARSAKLRVAEKLPF